MQCRLPNHANLSGITLRGLRAGMLNSRMCMQQDEMCNRLRSNYLPHVCKRWPIALCEADSVLSTEYSVGKQGCRMLLLALSILVGGLNGMRSERSIQKGPFRKVHSAFESWQVFRHMNLYVE